MQFIVYSLVLVVMVHRSTYTETTTYTCIHTRRPYMCSAAYTPVSKSTLIFSLYSHTRTLPHGCTNALTHEHTNSRSHSLSLTHSLTAVQRRPELPPYLRPRTFLREQKNLRAPAPLPACPCSECCVCIDVCACVHVNAWAFWHMVKQLHSLINGAWVCPPALFPRMF